MFYLQIAKARFGYMIWFMVSEKSITRCTFLHRGGACIHQSLSKQDIQKNCVLEFPEYMNTHVLTEGRNFETFSNVNYAMALDSCYLSTKKILNMESSVILIVPIKFAYILDIPELYSTFNE